MKKKEPLRKRLAKKGFVFDGQRIRYEPSKRKRDENLLSGLWKLPKKPKRLKLSDF